MSDALVEAIAALARDLPDETIARVAAAIELAPSTTHGIRALQQVVVAPAARERVRRTVAAWERDASVAPASVALALQAAGKFDTQSREAQQIELVWTGPTPGGTTLRRSDQVMLELVREARDTLTIVSFAAYRVASVHTALLDAAKRGAKIRFILESREESGGRANMDPWASMSRELAKQSELYVWPFDQRPTGDRGRTGLLHAKCAIADRRRIFVSSANFTGAALLLNMELGLLVEGGAMPGQIQDHFDGLILEHVLQRISRGE